MNNNPLLKKKKITFELQEDYLIALKEYCRNTGSKQGATIEILIKNFINSMIEENENANR